MRTSSPRTKDPVAIAYRTLAREAERAGVSFLFEGAVMDGIPMFNLVRETLPAVTINGFRGVVNSTTNHILTRDRTRRVIVRGAGEDASGRRRRSRSLARYRWLGCGSENVSARQCAA